MVVAEQKPIVDTMELLGDARKVLAALDHCILTQLSQPEAVEAVLHNPHTDEMRLPFGEVPGDF
jgi:hypothetical protein